MRTYNFSPVTSLAELDCFDEAELVEGYLSADAGDPEPGLNRGKAFWHGWRCRMMDRGLLPIDPTHYVLISDYVKRECDRRRAAKRL